jgi:hypothetical protein
MRLGCQLQRNCCGLVYDYPPVVCDTFCVGCDSVKLPKTAKTMEVEKSRQRGTSARCGRADEQKTLIARKSERRAANDQK